MFSFFKSFFLAFLVIAFIVLFRQNQKLLLNVHSSSDNNTPRKELDDEQITINIYKKAQESVVYINTFSYRSDPLDFFAANSKSFEGSGSGILIDAENGIIVTNFHVIQEAHKLEIILNDGKSYGARLLGYDKESDIAVLILEDPPKTLMQIPFGDSSKLQVGQSVLAIGNPFGLDKTLTTGIISSLDRAVKSPFGSIMNGMIQTDAAINPGNSGGPLLDRNGRLIGINTAILSQSGDSAGIGFAVPINEVRRILPELIATGKVLKPKMGWILVDTTLGPMVRRVFRNSPAARAGIVPVERPVSQMFVKGFVRSFKDADLIYSVNDIRVYSTDDVKKIISDADRDIPILLKLRTGGVNGKERSVSIKPIFE